MYQCGAPGRDLIPGFYRALPQLCMKSYSEIFHFLMFQIELRFCDWKGQQAMDLSAQGKGCEAVHCRGARPKDGHKSQPVELCIAKEKNENKSLTAKRKPFVSRLV